MSKTLKVGVIGIGGIANLHVPGWVASEHTELIAACDINVPVLQEWGKKNNVERLYTDAADLINDPDIDIVDIVTPNQLHKEMAIAALEAGKHVLCEKPLAPTPPEIQEMIEARDKAGKMLMTAQHHRFAGGARALKAELDRGVLGDVYHMRNWVLRRAGVPVRPTFIYKSLSGGGVNIDMGVHLIDLTLWFVGQPEPISVSGVSRTELAKQKGAFSVWGGDIPEGFDVEDFSVAFVRFDNGATLILEASWMLHHDTPGEDMQIWLYGTEGGAHWPKNELYTANNETKQHYDIKLKVEQEQMRPHAQQCIEFAQAIVDGAPSPIPAEDSLRVSRLLNAVYESQKTGREVRLDE